MKLSKHFIYIHQNKLNMKIYVGKRVWMEKK